MPSRIIRGTLIALLVACAGAFVTRHEFYVEALVDPFFGLALASILILHLRVRPRWTDALLVAVSTLAFAFIDFRLLHYPPTLTAWLSFIGVSSLLVLAAACVCAKESERKLLLYAWVPAFLFITSEWFASDMLEWTAAAHPKTLDLYLLSFDASLHVQLSFVIGRVFAYSQLLRASALFFYVGLAIPITLVYAGRLARYGTKAFSAMLAFLITGPLGVVFYNIFPACGPVHVANRYFPFHPLSISQMSRLVLEPVAITGPRNAIPSLHMAWTLLAWWYSRGLSRFERSVVLAFLFFTILATLGTGEHYFIDLIVAFPFALLIEALCSYELSWRDSARLQGLAFGLGGTLLWLLALRFANRLFWASAVIPWALAVATVIVAYIRHCELRNPTEQGESNGEPIPIALPPEHVGVLGPRS